MSEIPAELAYVAIASREPSVTKTFLGQDVGLMSLDATDAAGEPLAAFQVGGTALVVFPDGHDQLARNRPGVDHIAIASSDPEGGARATGNTPPPVATRGLMGRNEFRLDRDATCGVSVRLAPSLDLPVPDATDHSGAVRRIDHIGIASSDNHRAEHVFCATLGGVYESRQTDMEIATALESFTSDKYGAVYHSRAPQPVGGLRVSFVTFGDCELEFLQDFDPNQGHAIEHGAPGTTKQDQSAIGGFIARFGAGLHHIALKVDDIDAMLDRLAKRNYRVIDKVGRPGSRRARIGFIHPASTGGVLFHFVEREDLPPAAVG